MLQCRVADLEQDDVDAVAGEEQGSFAQIGQRVCLISRAVGGSSVIESVVRRVVSSSGEGDRLFPGDFRYLRNQRLYFEQYLICAEP